MSRRGCDHDELIKLGEDVYWLKWLVGGLYPLVGTLLGFKFFGG